MSLAFIGLKLRRTVGRRTPGWRRGGGKYTLGGEATVTGDRSHRPRFADEALARAAADGLEADFGRLRGVARAVAEAPVWQRWMEAVAKVLIEQH
jgi:hypothetical protein